MPADYIFYFFSIVVIYAFYIAAYLGVFVTVPEYIVVWYTFIQIFLCLILMYRYNPFRTKFEYNDFDARLIFGAASILLSNVITIPVLVKFLDPFKTMVLKSKILDFIADPKQSQND